MKPPVFILSLFDTGLYAARLLKNEGITVYGFDHDPDNPGFYSKYVTCFVVPQPQTKPQKLFEILLDKRKEFNITPILIAASENYLEFIFQYREALEQDFLFLLPSNELLAKIINKSGQLELAEKCGINVPSYLIINTIKELNAIEMLAFPVVIKGVNQPIWKNVIKNKTIVAKDRDQLLSIGRDLLKQNISFIAQQIVKGDCTNNFEYNSLFANGAIIEQSVNQKIRQFPPDFGYGSYVQTVANEDVKQLGARFVKENGIEGFSNTEFKLDHESGKYYFIETNARVWLQIELTNKNGQNFVLSYYNLLVNNQFDKKPTRRKTTLRWVDLPTDLLVFLRYRHQIGLSPFDFIKSTLNATNFGLLSLSDIKPFLKSIRCIK
jgi:D-aspartate ligase